jgi:hypothetical protein
MHTAVQSCPADLVFNLGEIGMSNWEHRKPKRAVIPITSSPQNIRHRISQKLKHLSVVTRIFTCLACLIRYTVTSQDFLTAHRALAATGMQIERHLILKQRDKPYINADLFENCKRTVILPHLASSPVLHKLSEEYAVLLMNNCSPYLTPVVIKLPSVAHVQIISVAPHTMQICQVLDLALFEVLKRRGQD